MKQVLAYVPDLMDRSRITAAGVEVTFAASPAALVAAAGEAAGRDSAAEAGGGAGAGAAVADGGAGAGPEVVVAEAAAGAGPEVVVVVDLGRPGVLGALSQIGLPVIGFASHVDRELLAAARAAGCETVLARSAFFSRLGALLSDP